MVVIWHTAKIISKHGHLNQEVVSNNTSIESSRHPYCRLKAWTEGIAGNPPLAETFLKRDKRNLYGDPSPAERITEMINGSWPKRGEWKTRPDNFRKVNGYQE